MNTFALFNEIVLKNTTYVQLSEQLTKRQIIYTGKQISNSFHISSQLFGFQVVYDVNNQKLDCIFLYLNSRKHKSYSQNGKNSLPFGLVENSTIKDALMLFGQPNKKSKFRAECAWSNLGIDIVYNGMSWNDENIKMEYICLYEPEKVNDCVVCHQEIKQNEKFRCKNCPIIKYCSSKCEQKHFRMHQMYCQQIE